MSERSDSTQGKGTVTFLLDGVEVTARSGQTLIEAASEAGLYIPRLCYRAGLPPGGHCRICTVFVNGHPAAACTTPAAEGLVVENDTEELNGMRKRLVEMLFAEGHHVCPSCEASGNCELQALGYRFGMLVPRYPAMAQQRAHDATHPDIFIDRDRCVLCGRCARASRALDGKTVFGFTGRGTDMRIAVNGIGGLADTDAEAVDEAIAACPVGCLLVKRKGIRVPVGQRRYDAAPIGSEIASRRPETQPASPNGEEERRA